MSFRLPVVQGCSILLLILAVLPLNAQAINLDIRSSPDNTLDFSLVLSRKQNVLAIQRGLKDRINNTYRQAGVSTVDVFPGGTQFGLDLGYTFFRQDNLTATQGLSLNGYYAGLSMQLPVITHSLINLDFSARYTWQSVKGSSMTQAASLEWNEAQAGLKMTVNQNPFKLVAGIYYSSIDATQTFSGNIQGTEFLSSTNNLLIHLGLDYAMADNEFTGIHFFNGANNGIELQFRKLFR